MAGRGHRYPLLIYRHMLNRWWPPVLMLGVVLVVTVAISWLAAWFLPLGKNPIPTISELTGIFLLAAGGLAIGFAIFLVLLRSQAYVQAFGNYLRVATPFLRFNISYKRVKRTYTADMRTLFPPRSLSKWRREVIRPLGSKTAVVIELRGFPVSAGTLRAFLSPFFFKDKTAHIVLLMKDWMRFSTEIESLRAGGQLYTGYEKSRRRSGLLSSLDDDSR